MRGEDDGTHLIFPMIIVARCKLTVIALRTAHPGRWGLDASNRNDFPIHLIVTNSLTVHSTRKAKKLRNKHYSSVDGGVITITSHSCGVVITVCN